VEDEKRKPVFGFLSDFVSNEEYQNYILVPAVVIITAVGIYFVNIPGIEANRTLINGLISIQKGEVLSGMETLKLALSYKTMGDAEIREQLISLTPSVLKANNVDQKTKQDFLNLTFSEVENQIAIVPDDARYYILAGSLLNSIGNPEQALSYIKKAIELSPEKQRMRFDLVQALYSLGSSTEAMNEAKSAYELDKRFDQAKQVYRATVENEIKVNPKFKVEGEQIIKELNATTTNGIIN
jgi:tetratricopeptide (TPR) repeat protein